MLKSNFEIDCEGWWQQALFGRQPMTELRLKFNSGLITGSGRDIIGPFTFRGTINQQGHVAMVKQYIGQHTVDYVGTYDGEGLLYGEWHIRDMKDRWLIKIKGAKSCATSGQEIATID